MFSLKKYEEYLELVVKTHHNEFQEIPEINKRYNLFSIKVRGFSNKFYRLYIILKMHAIML